MNKSVFVFGSNLAGRHGKGAALCAAQEHSAEYGVGEGLTGNAYAIPTKDESIKTLSLDDIEKSVKRFISFAEEHQELTFNVTRIGCGLAGYTDQDILPLFKDCPSNCTLPGIWQHMLNPDVCKLIIAGGRDYNDYEDGEQRINRITQNLKNVEIISGMAKGADAIGIKYAKEHGLILHEFSAQWDRLGKAAGYKRNIEMANAGSHLIAFWDGKSRGTKHMIKVAKDFGLKVRIAKYGLEHGSQQQLGLDI